MLGSNMFSYCLNNPVNLVDQSGCAPSVAIKIFIKSILGGIVNAVCAASTGQPLQEVAYAFFEGVVLGFFSEVIDGIDIMINIGNAVATVIDCYSNGVDLGLSLLAGLYSFATSLVYCSDAGFLAECLVDVTFGLGFSLTAEGVAEALKANANRYDSVTAPATSAPQSSTPSSPQSMGKPMSVVGPMRDSGRGGTPSKYVSPSLPQFTFSSGNGYKVPIVSNIGWTG